MDGIAAITSRIAEIRGTLAAFAPPQVATAPAPAAVGTPSAVRVPDDAVVATERDTSLASAEAKVDDVDVVPEVVDVVAAAAVSAS